MVKQLVVWRYRGVRGAIREFAQRCSCCSGDLVQILLLPSDGGGHGKAGADSFGASWAVSALGEAPEEALGPPHSPTLGRHPAAFLRRAGSSTVLTLSRSWCWLCRAAPHCRQRCRKTGCGRGARCRGGNGSVPSPGLGHGASCDRDAVLGGKGSAPLVALMWG